MLISQETISISLEQKKRQGDAGARGMGAFFQERVIR